MKSGNYPKRSQKAKAEQGKRTGDIRGRRDPEDRVISWHPPLPSGPQRIRLEDLPPGCKELDTDLYELPDGTIAEIED